MNKKFSLLIIGLGCLLILLSASYFAFELLNQKQLFDKLPEITAQLEELLPEKSYGVIEPRLNNIMPAINIDGENFVGILEVPKYNIKLPVFSEWKAGNSAKRPALYYGSVYDGTLIIGGRYAKGQFDFIDKLDAGEKIFFTDLLGQQFIYTVSEIKHAEKIKIDSLLSDKISFSFFVKKDGQYIIARCNIAVQ